MSQPPGYSVNPEPSATYCPCRSESPSDASAASASETTSLISTIPCPGRGYPCDDCPGGWFCPPQETPAQSVACGLSWPCYHCSSGLYCISTSQAMSQSSPSSGTATTESPESSVPQSAPAISSSTTSVTSPKPTVGGVPGNWIYIGCFQDSQARVLQGPNMGDNTLGGMTNTRCVQHCQDNGYNYAGTENKSECWCGNELQSGSTKLPDSACTMPCQSSETECCGGAWAISVYACSLHLSTQQ